jgi:hypothetical protein
MQVLQHRDISLRSQVRFHKTALDLVLASTAATAEKTAEAAAAAAAADATAAAAADAASTAGAIRADTATALLVRAVEEELRTAARRVDLAKEAAAEQAEQCKARGSLVQGVGFSV